VLDHKCIIGLKTGTAKMRSVRFSRGVANITSTKGGGDGTRPSNRFGVPHARFGDGG
jgi:hypothetical protein